MLEADVQVEIILACPNCKSSHLTVWCKGFDRLHRINSQEFTYSKCNNCQLIFLSERPLEEEIYKYYPEDYGPYHASFYISNGQRQTFKKKNSLLKKSFKTLFKISRYINPVVKKTFPEKFSHQFEHYYQLPHQNAIILDFGCGSDHFLNQARSRGWNTIGMDFSEKALDSVKRSGHTAVLYGSDNAWANIENNSLDFVRMNHVIEHLYHPQPVLSALHLKMKKGAILHIATPNAASISASLFKSRWRGLECPRHIMLYSPVVLERILKHTGFSANKLIFENITKDFARSLAMYEYEKGYINHSEIEKKMEDFPLASTLYIPSRIAAGLKKADRFHAFAVK